jgi:hypothetical protein
VTTHTLTARTARGDIDVDRVTSTDPDLIRSYLDDAAHYPGGHASTVGRPRSEAEVAALLTASNRVLPVGDQSSLTGGATPVGGTVLSTEALDKVVLTSRSEIRVQAGVSLRLLQDTLDRQGAFYPPVPTYDGPSGRRLALDQTVTDDDIECSSSRLVYLLEQPHAGGCVVLLPRVLELARCDYLVTDTRDRLVGRRRLRDRSRCDSKADPHGDRPNRAPSSVSSHACRLSSLRATRPTAHLSERLALYHFRSSHHIQEPDPGCDRQKSVSSMTQSHMLRS